MSQLSTHIRVWGDQEPRFQMNSFNEITFKNNLSLRFLIHWKNGGENVNLTNLLNDLGVPALILTRTKMATRYRMV
jgi:hypothetical protein